jgi:hypothetical protein
LQKRAAGNSNGNTPSNSSSSRPFSGKKFRKEIHALSKKKPKKQVLDMFTSVLKIGSHWQFPPGAMPSMPAISPHDPHSPTNPMTAPLPTPHSPHPTASNNNITPVPPSPPEVHIHFLFADCQPVPGKIFTDNQLQLSTRSTQ